MVAFVRSSTGGSGSNQCIDGRAECGLVLDPGPARGARREYRPL